MLDLDDEFATSRNAYAEVIKITSDIVEKLVYQFNVENINYQNPQVFIVFNTKAKISALCSDGTKIEFNLENCRNSSVIIPKPIIRNGKLIEIYPFIVIKYSSDKYRFYFDIYHELCHYFSIGRLIKRKYLFTYYVRYYGICKTIYFRFFNQVMSFAHNRIYNYRNNEKLTDTVAEYLLKNDLHRSRILLRHIEHNELDSLINVAVKKMFSCLIIK